MAGGADIVVAVARTERQALLVAAIAVVVMLLVIPVVMLWRILRRARLAAQYPAGRCDKCGYDLRGGHDRCPECGTIAEPSEGEDAPRSVHDLLLECGAMGAAPQDAPAESSGTAFLKQLAERFVLRSVEREQLPAEAIHALELGADGDYLRRLAGWTPAREISPEDLFVRVLEEQGIALPRHEDLIRDRLRPIVHAFLDRKLDIALLADVLKERVGEDSVLSYGEPAWLLWCYACDWHGGDLQDFFEQRAREEAEALRQGYLNT